MSISRLRVRHFLRQKKAGAKTLDCIKSDLTKLITIILIGNNIMNIGAAAIATGIAIDAFGSKGWV